MNRTNPVLAITLFLDDLPSCFLFWLKFEDPVMKVLSFKLEFDAKCRDVKSVAHDFKIVQAKMTKENTFHGLWTVWTKFHSRSATEQRLFLEAFFCLGISRLAILLVPFRRIAPFLGHGLHKTPQEASECNRLARIISWAVQAAGRYTPWESKCLARAMTAKIMLKRRDIPSTLYLGLSKEGSNGLSAHAWIRCGDTVLTGAPGHRQFTVIATFGDRFLKGISQTTRLPISWYRK